MKIKIKRLRKGIKIPTRGTSQSAGWDVYCPEPVFLFPNSVVGIKLGFSVEIPDGYYLSFVPRSSLGKKGIFITNSPGTIDSDYRGELGVMLLNISNYPGSKAIQEGDRIGQVILLKYNEIEFEEVEELNETERGTGGFGSTGR